MQAYSLSFAGILSDIPHVLHYPMGLHVLLLVKSKEISRWACTAKADVNG